MLIPKKIEKNKLILYISIIVIMLGGTGFFLYKNYSLTAAKKTTVMEMPAGMEGVPDYNSDSFLEEDIQEESAKGEKDQGSEETDLSSAKKIKEKESLDLSLLAESKFKRLKENLIKLLDFKIGKKDPFVPD